MCDFSLHGVKNRLAVEGEYLVINKFHSGSKGLASPSDFEAARPRGLKARVFSLLFPEESRRRQTENVPAVCIPPGARLYVEGIPDRIRADYALSDAEEVTFTQLTAEPFRYRDAFRFKNGAEILIQKFPEGMRVEVLQLALAEETEEVEVEEPVAVANRSERRMSANA